MGVRRTLVLGAFGCVAVSGCSSNVGVTEGVGLLPSASTSEVNADYDDIDAAVAVAAGKNEMAVLWSNDRSESPRRFYLKTVRDEPVYLFIGRQPSFEPPRPSQRNQTGVKPPEDLVMRCTVGRWGDDRREEDLLDAIEDRLDELRGKDAAPIRR